MTDGTTAEFIRELATAAEELQQAALSLERIAAGGQGRHGSDATAERVRRTGGETESRRLERTVTENTRALRDSTAALRRLSDKVEKSLDSAAPFVVLGQ